MKPKNSSTRTPSLLFICLCAALPSATLATDYTWNGLGTDDLWGTGANWAGGFAPAPSSTNNLIFAGTTRLTPQDNYGDGDDFQNITFDSTAGAFTISNTGTNGIDWFGSITNNSTNLQTIGFRLYQSASNTINATSGDITLNSSALLFRNGQALTLNAASGKSITLAGVIADGGGGAGSAISITGGGTVNLRAANTFTSGIIIKSGTVVGDVNGGTLNSIYGTGTIQIGDSATGANATLNEAGFGNALANAITVDSGAGTRNLVSSSNNGGQIPQFTGGITLNSTLTLSATSLGGMRINSVINDGAGTNGLIIDSAGTGTVRLNQTNTFDGGIVIKRGILEQNTAAAALGTGTVTIGDSSGSNTATLQASGTGFTATNAITVAAGNAGTNSILANSGNSFVYSGNVTLNNNLTLGALSTGNLTLSGGIASASGTRTITNSGTGTGSVTLSTGIISNAAGTLNIQQNSAGSTLYLLGANTFTGGIALKSGTISINNTTGLGATANVVTLGDSSGASVTLVANGSGAASNIDQPVNVTGTGTNTISGTWNNGGQINLLRGAITLNSTNLTINSTLASGWRVQAGVTGTGNLTIQANGTGNIDMRTVAINNVGTITNSGTGTGVFQQGTAISFGANITSLIQNSTTSNWNINQPNANFVGSSQVLAGTMAVTNASGLSGSNAVSVKSGATFDIRDVSLTIAGLNDATTGGTVAQTTSTALRTLTLGGSGTYAFSGNITPTTTANLALTKSGAGTQTLSGANTYEGLTSISNGTLKLGSTTALGGIIGTTTISGTGTLDFGGQSISEVLGVAGTGIGGNGALVNSGAAMTLNSEITNGAAFTVGGAGDITLQRARSGGAPFIITKIGAGTLTLGNANTTTHMNLLAIDVESASTVNLGITSGNFIVADRGVKIAAGGTVKYTGTSTNMIVDGAEVLVSNGTLDMNGKSDTIGKVTIGDGTNNGVISGGSGSTLTVTGSYNLFGTNTSGGSGSIEAQKGSVDVILAGTGTALNKTTSGTVTLSQANTYTGATTISAGVLALFSTGSIANSTVITANGTLDTSAKSAFAIGGSQTLSGSGTVIVGSGNTMTVAGNLAPGNSPGVLTVSGGTTVLDTGSIFSWELNDNVDSTTGTRGTHYDGLTTTNGGNLTVNTGAIFKVILTGAVNGGATFWQSSKSWTNIFNVAGTTTNAGANLFDTIQVFDGTTGSLFTPVDGSFTFTGSTLSWTAVPEPTSALAGLLLGAGLLRRRRISARSAATSPGLFRD